MTWILATVALAWLQAGSVDVREQVDVEYVLLDVVAVDRHSRLVTDLTLKGFQAHRGQETDRRRLVHDPGPADRDRSANRRWRIVLQQLAQGEQTTDLTETIAIALAATGRFEQAVEWQRSVADAVRGAGQAELASRSEENLARYAGGKLCRVPRREDDPIHHPARDAEPARPERPRA